MKNLKNVNNDENNLSPEKKKKIFFLLKTLIHMKIKIFLVMMIIIPKIEIAL